MSLCRSTLFLLVTLLVGQDLHARRNVPIGGDLCQLLLTKINHPETSDLIDANARAEDVTLGWGVGPDGTGDRLRTRISDLLRGRRDTGETEEQAMFNYLSANTIGKRDTFKWRWVAPRYLAKDAWTAPQTMNHESMKRVQDTIHRTDVVKIVEQYATRKKKTPDDIEDVKILIALDNIEQGSTVGADDMKAIERLHGKITDLGTRAQKLRAMLGEEGQADLLTWDYLKNYDTQFRNKIRRAPQGENLYISYPTMDPLTQKVTIKVKKVQNLDDYEVFFKEFERRGKRVISYNLELEKYTFDYLKYHALATRFKAIETRDVKFHSDIDKPHESRTEDLARFEEIRANENKNAVAYRMYREGINRGILPNREIHPSPELLKSVRFWKTMGKNWLEFKYYYVGAIGVSVTAWILRNQVIFLSGLIINPIANFLEEKHALDEEYWVEKCAKKKTKEEIDECLVRWGNIAVSVLTKQIEEKRKKLGPDYSGKDERLLFADMSERIPRATYKKAAFSVTGGMTVQYHLMWAPQEDFALEQKELELYRKARDERAKSVEGHAQQPAPDSLPALAVIGSVPPGPGAGTPAGKSTREFALAEVERLKEEQQKQKTEMKRSLLAHSTDPQKQLDALWGYNRSLTMLYMKLSDFKNAELGDDFAVRVEAQLSLMEDESNKVLEQVRQLVAQIKPSPVATPVPVPPPTSQIEGGVVPGGSAEPIREPSSELPR
jgi:hypothetical protein